MKHILNDISRSELERAIDEWILNERDRGMLKRRRAVLLWGCLLFG